MKPTSQTFFAAAFAVLSSASLLSAADPLAAAAAAPLPVILTPKHAATRRINGPKIFGVRDLWRQQDPGEFETRFEATVAPHGVVMVRIFPAK